MSSKASELEDDQAIDFRFSTFGELKRTFGPARAASLLRTKQKKEGLTDGGLPLLTEEDIGVALQLLRGEKTGAQSSKALRVFKHYFASTEQRRKACETFLKEKRAELVTQRKRRTLADYKESQE
ncbi:MAG TPA: hypothetical protein VNH82_10780 [Candidatus Dormibacteraeota bacterium]|jgi:hypothetical protein|nr:hypothetical protein [Candidatus Dormibacteraeota bacterium]